MALIEHSSKVNELLRRLDEAVSTDDTDAVCRNVKRVLQDVVKSGEEFLDAPFLVPAPDRYARRLLHRDPRNRYTAVIMVWDHGQGTPLHDHAGMWCVDRGTRIRVTSFDLETDAEAERLQFTPESVVLAGKGEAGHLIPPFEYHMIENPDTTPAITIHVYGGEMTHCNAFFPLDGGGYRREERTLSYTA